MEQAQGSSQGHTSIPQSELWDLHWLQHDVRHRMLKSIREKANVFIGNLMVRIKNFHLTKEEN